jgi:hypothetical protein
VSLTFKQSRIRTLFGIALVSTACASSAGLSGESDALRDNPTTDLFPRVTRTSDRLTANELHQANVRSTADGVRNVRPDFLRSTLIVSQGSVVRVGPSVVLNGGFVGGPEALETIALDAVDEIRYYRPPQARDFWGASCQCAGGVILVRTKRAW